MPLPSMDESLGRAPRCSEAMVDRYNNKGYGRRAQGHAWVGDADRMNAPTSKPLACSFSIMFWICLKNPFKQKFPLTISGMAIVESISSPWGRHRTVSPCLPSHPQYSSMLGKSRRQTWSLQIKAAVGTGVCQNHKCGLVVQVVMVVMDSSRTWWPSWKRALDGVPTATVRAQVRLERLELPCWTGWQWHGRGIIGLDLTSFSQADYDDYVIKSPKQ